MRKRRTAAEWAEIVRQWRASGLSVREFSERNGIVRGTLGWWATRLRASQATETKLAHVADNVMKRPTSFTELRVVSSGEPSVIEVSGPRGLVVRVRGIVEEQTLLRVLRAVAQC